MSAPPEKECRRLAERALSFAPTPDASVSLAFTRSSSTRFANNEITTSGDADAVIVVVTVTKDARTGRVSLNETSDAALERAMKRAAEIAALVPPDPEDVGPLPKQAYRSITGWDAATEKTAAAERLPGVRAVVEPSAKAGFNASGFFNNGSTVQCLANKAGNFGYHRSTAAGFSATARSADGTGSGWAEDTSFRVSEIDAPALATRALQKSRDSQGAKPLDPGDYTVILEPAAVAGLLGFNFTAALSARNVEEGRSYFSKKGGGTLVGERLFHESVTLKSDPLDPRRPGSPWTGATGFGGGGGGGGGGFGGPVDSGVATSPVTWIEKGVLERLAYDRYWARKGERAATPPAANFVLEGGDQTLEQLIASTDRGLLVTNLHYIRVVNPQTMQLTGLTRDGMWLIEKGKIVRAVSNFRFNESPAVLLQNVLGMTAAVRSGNMVVPAIKSSAFTFSSQSDAV